MSSATTIVTELSLYEAYEAWRQLVETAGEAIRVYDWSVVSECHRRITAIQPRITQLTNEIRKEWRSVGGAEASVKEQKLRGIVSSLIEQETRNNSLLATAKQSARNNLDNLSRARQNLRRIHRTYASTLGNSLNARASCEKCST